MITWAIVFVAPVWFVLMVLAISITKYTLKKAEMEFKSKNTIGTFRKQALKSV